MHLVNQAENVKLYKMHRKNNSIPRTQYSVDSDDGGSGGVENSIVPSIDMPGQPFLSDIIGEHTETEIGPTVDVERIPSYENVWILPKLDVSKAYIFALCELGLVPSSNIRRID